ncbi:response regulator transcription factor [Chloroflexota bacterium]
MASKHKALALVILEMEAKEQQGIRVCRRLRESSAVPIIMVAAKHGEDDIVRSLQAGADEFIAKPVGMAEFSARLEALFRLSKLQKVLSLSN